MRTHWLWVLVVLALACEREDEARREPVHRTQHATVPGVETAAAAVDTVRDVIHAFGAVTAAAEPPEIRDARAQLIEAEARERLAAQQVRRLAALARGAVAPRKELEAARAEEASAAAAGARARQTLAAFGAAAVQTALAADEVWVIAQVIQRDVAPVVARAPARFLPEAFPARSFAGEVDAPVAYVDPATHTAPVRVRVRNPDGVLRPGMTGAVAVEVGAPRAAVTVPASAVIYDGEHAVVFVVDSDERYTPQPVRLGVSRDGRVEVVAGVTPGTRVVVTGAASLWSAARLPAAGDEG